MLRNILLSFSFFAVFAVFFAEYAHAATSSCTPGIPCTSYTVSSDANSWKKGGDTCDGDYMNQIYSEAYMQAQREMSMNAQLIRKPDSILEYTCFDQFLYKTHTQAAKIFSETRFWSRWGTDGRETYKRPFTFKTADETVTDEGLSNVRYGSPNYPSGSLGLKIDLLIADTLKNYINSNFSHTFLGGASTLDNNIVYPGRVGDFYHSIGKNYSCSQMSAVWQLSKCKNISSNEQFVSFGQLINGDPRQLPVACAGKPAPIVGDGAPPEAGVGSLRIPIIDTYLKEILDPLGVQTMTETNPCPEAGSTKPISADMIRLSNNCELKYSSFELAKSYFEYTRDPYFPIHHTIDAIASAIKAPWIVWGALNLCGPPIPTGVKMPYYYSYDYVNPLTGLNTVLNPSESIKKLSELLGISIAGLDYIEHVCPNPSCYFIPGLNVCLPPKPVTP